MARRLAVWVPLEGPLGEFSVVFHRDPAGWLPEPAEPRGTGRWEINLHAGPVVRAVTCAVGAVSGEPGSEWRRITWRADDQDEGTERTVPAFDGHLGIRGDDETETGLVLEGAYVTPPGPLGAALDPGQLQKLVEAIAGGFLWDVAARLTAASMQSS